MTKDNHNETKRFTFLLLTLLSAQLNGQVTIGSGEMPDANALLDLKEKMDGTSTKGFLLPRVALSALSNASPMITHTKGMVVYNTATVNDVTPGFYFNDRSQWVRLIFSRALND